MPEASSHCKGAGRALYQPKKAFSVAAKLRRCFARGAAGKKKTTTTKNNNNTVFNGCSLIIPPLFVRGGALEP